MKSLALKICGMRDADNIREISILCPDLMGFIFYRESPRYVGDDFICPDLPFYIRRSGVFVNESMDHLLRIASRNRLWMVQLHGDESPEYCKAVRAAGYEVTKVFRVDDLFSMDTVSPWVSDVDYFLFDTRGPPPGGNGMTFNWAILDQYKFEVPFFISGGITPENLKEVLNIRSPFFTGVDVNSGIESAPGIKDFASAVKVCDLIRSSFLV
ncbi:MAG: phosphoribosylanthranilate isomerase [Bacteroidota bacterium]